MRSRCFLMIAVLLLVIISAANVQSQTPQVRGADLSSTPISAGPLRITIKELKGPGLLGSPGHVTVLLENTSDAFVTFSPSRLSFVNQDGTQVDVLCTYTSLGYLPAVDHDLAPKAHMKINREYELTDKVELPARLYYDRRLIAEIMK